MDHLSAREQHQIRYGLVWLAGSFALLLLILQVTLRFELGSSGMTLVRVGDLVVAYIFLTAARRARAAIAQRDLLPLPISTDLWAVGVFAAVSAAELVVTLVFKSQFPAASAVSALGKALLVFFAVRLRSRVLAREYSPTVRAVVLSPPATVAMSFLLVITAGWLLLSLPEASATGHSIGILDSLFTATSATCVTGLIVKDTPQDFSGFGLFIILLLIQLGGLGIMTLAGLFGVAMGQRVSMRQRMIVRDTLVAEDPHAAGRMLGLIALYAFIMEAVGATFLYLRWVIGGVAPLKAAWLAVFHSISAFCNAGFSLFSNSLEDYSADLSVNVIIAVLIIVGGIGAPVVLDILHHLRLRISGKRARLSLHSKLVLWTTAVLLLLGYLGFWLLEWNNLLAQRSILEGVCVTAFQSITPRTAGFNTVPMASLAEATKFLIVLLMFIGASPGSTGGGIKTATAAVVAAVGRAMIMGESKVHMFQRSLPEDVRHRAVGIVIVFGLSVLVWTFMLSISEGGAFIDILFEAMSAFGTVGLSTGVTSGLTPFGRLAIIVAMYMGRVGPLTLALAIAQRRQGTDFTYPGEPVMVG